MDEGRLKLPLSALLLLIAVGSAVDLVLDQPAPLLSFHVLYELAMVLGALGISAWLWTGWRNAERSGADLRRALVRSQQEREVWRANTERLMAGLGAAVQQQFAEWRLTPSEAEVALQVLKGKSHKEIAAATGRSERTVRQHAAAAYEKAGVDGRAGLAAFFLGNLELPASPPSTAADRTRSDTPVSG